MGSKNGNRGSEKKLRKKFWGAENIPTFATRHGGDGEGRTEGCGDRDLRRRSCNGQTDGTKKSFGKIKKSLQVQKSFLPLQSQTKRGPTDGVRKAEKKTETM